MEILYGHLSERPPAILTGVQLGLPTLALSLMRQ